MLPCGKHHPLFLSTRKGGGLRCERDLHLSKYITQRDEWMTPVSSKAQRCRDQKPSHVILKIIKFTLLKRFFYDSGFLLEIQGQIHIQQNLMCSLFTDTRREVALASYLTILTLLLTYKMWIIMTLFNRAMIRIKLYIYTHMFAYI